MGDNRFGKAPRWALGFKKQFDLVRAEDGEVYLTRWWLVNTPWGGIALHRMLAPDARLTVHDHPWSFVSLVLRGGYLERRLHPRTMQVDELHRVHRVNMVRRGEAHSIRMLTRVPTWTLVFTGPVRRTWGFWEHQVGGLWFWTKHDAFDSGHYVPTREEARR